MVILHEIGHGYQGKFMQDPTLSVSEVWNNIYASFYQQLTLSQDNHLYTDGWLYNYGKLAAQEAQLVNYITDKTPVTSWSLRSRLQFLMLMLFKAGIASFRTLIRTIANLPIARASSRRIISLPICWQPPSLPPRDMM